jgi:hypothetical protein
MSTPASMTGRVRACRTAGPERSRTLLSSHAFPQFHEGPAPTADPRLRPLAKAGAAGVAAFLLTALFVARPADAAGRTIWVDSASRYGRCSDHRARVNTTRARPMCTMSRAALVARAGDVVRVARGSYRGPVQPRSSGAARRPLRFQAEGPVVIDARGRRSGFSLVGKHDIAISGFKVTGATRQGVWIDHSTRITITGLVSQGNKGAGMQLRNSSSVTVRRANISSNFGVGVQELGGVATARYLNSVVNGNGRNRWSFNGDGFQISGRNTIVRGNVIESNGNNATYEHGVYIGRGARNVLIESNRIRSNAAANIKAMGSGTIRYNKLGGSRLAIYIGGTVRPGYTVQYNVAQGTYKDAVIVGSKAIARLWNNTLVNKSTGGDRQPTALLVASARSIDLRNNLLVTKARAGRAVAVPAPGALVSMRADHNWYSSPNTSQPTAWGSTSLSLDGWKAATHQDRATVVSQPPALTSEAKVAGRNLGHETGTPLGLTRDVAANPVPSDSRPDIGAFET